MPTIGAYVPIVSAISKGLIRVESKVRGQEGRELDRRHCGVFYDL
jgi:hypothetical protein